MRNNYNSTFLLFIFVLFVIFSLFFVLFVQKVGAEGTFIYLPLINKSTEKAQIQIDPLPGEYKLGFPDMVVHVGISSGQCRNVWLKFDTLPKSEFLQYHPECYCKETGCFANVLLSIYAPTSLSNLEVLIETGEEMLEYPQQGKWTYIP